MAVMLPTSIAIILMEVIAGVFTTVTILFVICTCCLCCHKKFKKRRTMPLKTPDTRVSRPRLLEEDGQTDPASITVVNLSEPSPATSEDIVGLHPPLMGKTKVSPLEAWNVAVETLHHHPTDLPPILPRPGVKLENLEHMKDNSKRSSAPAKKKHHLHKGAKRTDSTKLLLRSSSTDAPATLEYNRSPEHGELSPVVESSPLNPITKQPNQSLEYRVLTVHKSSTLKKKANNWATGKEDISSGSSSYTGSSDPLVTVHQQLSEEKLFQNPLTHSPEHGSTHSLDLLHNDLMEIITKL